MSYAAAQVDPALDRRPQVSVEFYSVAEEDSAQTREAGHAVFVDVDYCRWWKRGTNQSATECRVSRMKKFYPHIWAIAEAAHDAWKKGHELPVEGVPLAQWPMVSRAQVENFRLINVRTVEDLAGTTENDFNRIGPGARELREKARAWLKVAHETGRIAEVLRDRDEQITALAASNEELRSDVAELRSALDKLKPRQRALRDDA